MNWCLRTTLGDFDLEDCKILKVDRSENEIKIKLSFARAMSGTENGSVNYEVISEPTLLVQGVVKEEIEGQEPDSNFPLDLVEVVKHTDGKLELSGYRNNKPWYVWSIEAKNISITW
jgi:hypothetical protein